jgi:hypothetical protein
MTKREFSLGFVAISLWLASHMCQAQQEFAQANLVLNNPALFRAATPALWSSSTLSNPISFDWMMPETPLPPSSDLATRKTLSAPATSDKRLPDRLSDIVPKFSYATGEIGFMYGRSTGKYGGNSKQAYILGEAGNDKTQIFAGASYEDSSFRFPRSGR